MGRFKAVIRLLKERLEALSLRRGIAAFCILTAVTMFSFAAPFALNFSYAETTADEPAASQEEGNTETNQNTAQQPGGGQTEANGTTGTTESTGEPQTTAEDTTYKNDATKLKELLEDSNNEWATVDISDGKITKIITSSPLQCLIVLSNVAPELYEIADITLNFTGESNLSSGSVTVDSEVLTFQGLGSRDHSFKGNFIPGEATLLLSRTLFNSITLKDNTTYTYKLNWFAGDGCDSIFASEVIALGKAGSPSKLNLTIELVKDESVTNNPVTRLNAPSVGDTKGNLDINAGYIIGDPDTLQINITNDGNAGLLVNSHSDGTLKLTSSGLSFSGAVIKSLNHNAGLLVGMVYKTDGGVETSLEITNNYETKSDDNIKITAGKSAGGLIGEVDTATIKADEDIILTGVSVKGVAAGGFVGSSKDVKYIIEQDKNIKPSLSVGEKGSSQYAGGLFGVYETSLEDATIDMTYFDFGQRVTLEAKGTTGIVGGLAGKIALTENGSNTGRLTINMPKNTNATASSSEDSESAEAGENGAAEGESSASNEGETGESSEGGLLTNLLGSIEGLAEDADAGKYGLKSTLSTNSKVKAYGGVVGQLTGTDELKTGLTISSMNVWAKSEGQSKYKSGIAAIVGNEDGTKPAALIIDNDAVADMENADTSDLDNGAFGGVAAFVGSKSVVYDKGNTTITTVTGTGVTAGGGLIGVAGKGSAVRLAGITDISGVVFESSDQLTRIGQLVGVQDSALVYADGSGSDAETGGWDYIRSGTAMFDDIGNYGQVYRLHADEHTSGLITMDDSGNEPTYQVTIAKSDKSYNAPTQASEGTAEGNEAGTHTGSETSETGTDGPAQPAEGESSALAEETSDDAVDVAIDNLSDFARLAITIQTEGYFSGYDTIDTGNWRILLNDTLNLTGDINLTGGINHTGTGITGITRDSIGASETPAVFTGTINGGGNKITLSIGEAYGEDTSQEGDSFSKSEYKGRVYRHNRLGLFSYGNGGATNLIIDGNINFEALEAGIAAGAYSACSNGGDKSFTGCSFEPEITYKTNEKLCYVGGVIGMLDGTATNKTTFTGGTRIAPTISIDAVTSKGVDVTGGAIGYVGGACPAEIISDDAVLSATVSNSSNSYTASLAAGYIGIIMPSDSVKDYKRAKDVEIEFKNTVMDGHSVSLTAGSATGGLLGYMWADTNVCFTGGNGSYGLSVYTGSDKTELNAVTNTAGGLVYRASGKWTVNYKGINLGGAKISGVRTSLGLLVCRGAYGDESVGGTKCTSGALYLELTAPWNEASPLSSKSSDVGYVEFDSSCNASVFDEFVAFTMSGDGSFDNNKSGVISLQTAGSDKKVIMNGSEINTYINRSSYGLTHQTNGSSRYYYNLDTAIGLIGSGEKANNTVIDTPEELLIWSVNIYAGSNIKKYFELNDAKILGTQSGQQPKTTIGSNDNTDGASLDMCGYSYYPVTINNRNIEIKNAEIKFYNDKIEASENNKNNKNTSDGTQHYAMHCGLFRDFNNSSSVEGDYSISCQNLKLGGSVGMIGQSSGALISGTIEGFVNIGTNMFSVDLEGITLNQLVVNGVDSGTKYAPLLINQSGSYSLINVNNLNYNNETTKIAGTSLIGNVGICDGEGKPISTQVSVIFNRVRIPSNNNNVFTRASLLNSFCFDVNNGVGSAVYNFTTTDRTDGAITYGREIEDSKEYRGLQLHYFDTDDIVKNEMEESANLDNPVFKDYLPYVYKEYVENSGYHEIAVNQKVSDILRGCGTYMDPYVITDSDQLISIAKYINNPNSGVGMSITITNNQEGICNNRVTSDEVSNHITYKKNAGRKWISENASTKSNDTIYRYMQSAYYYISQDIELGDKFPGIGNKDYPFRGVIIGRIGDSGDVNKITITSSSLKGFIPCSYGSVIKNLEIEYKGNDTIHNITINYESPKKNDYSPNSYFGGVIGLILGGDNIIDNVTVGMNEEDPLMLNLQGDQRHLIPTGGYIGAISGGGVIFRNTQVNKDTGGLSNEWIDNTQIMDESKHLKVDETAKNSLYVNPVIGRVISGYAFSEGCELYNTDKNYRINSISKSSSTETDIVTGTIAKTNAAETTVNSAQGLMILSAIIQSGAGAGHTNNSNICGTLPYYGIEEIKSDGFLFGNGKYGKVRNASYEYIGQPNGENNQNDFNISLDDDMHAPGLYNTKGETSETELLKLVNTSEDINSPYLVKNYATTQTEFICASHVSLMRLKLKAGETFDMTRYGPAYVGLTGRYKSNSVQTDGANAIDRTVPYIICVSGNNYGQGKNCSLLVEMNINEYSDDDFRSAGAGALFSTAYWYYNSKEAAEGLKNNNYNAINGINLKDSTIGIHYFDVNKGKEVEDADASIRGAGVGGLVGNMNSYSTGTKYQTALISDVSVSNVNVYSPYAAGSIIGSAGNKSREFSDDDYHTIGKGAANLFYHLINCTYDSVEIYGARFAGGFVGYSNPKDKTTANGLDVTKGDNDVGRNSLISSDLVKGLSGGIIGYQQGTFSLNDPNYKAIDTDKNTYYSSGDKDLKTANFTNVEVSGNIAGGIVGEVENTITARDIVFTDNSSSDKYHGLITGKDCTGGVVGRTTQNKTTSGFTFDDITVKNVSFTTYGSNNGGIIGHLQNNSSEGETLSITNSEVSGCSFSRAEGASAAGATSGGAIGTVADTNVNTVVRNFVSSGNSFVGANSSGFIGSASGNIYGCNILISGNSLINASRGGHLYGSIQSGAKTRIAGLSVKLKPEETSEESKKLIGVDNAGVLSKNDASSYIAFADYTGKASSSVASKTLLDATQEYPYVTTSPISSISVNNSESESRFLFGDGIGTVDENGEPVVTASTIVDEIGTSDNSTRFKYGNSKSAKFNFESQLSTLKKNNEDTGIKDIPVVRVAGGDTSGIEGYLDVITNGGYSKAKKVNAQENNTVTADVNVYKWDSNLGAFVVSNDDPSIVVKNNGSSDMVFRSTTEYDNDEKKFSLVTVTFNEAGSVYKIHVPVLVRRILEIDFTATLNYGTSFKEEAYKRLGRGAHVLESFGNPVTALITFKYNSAYRVDTEYGWTTYLDAGGSMREVEKTISFVDGETDKKRIPKGTKLSLVDCTDGKIYTTTYDGSGSVGLSSFKDSAGKNYKNKWLSTLMNVKASGPITDGKWVKCAENDVDAVADVLGQKYKLASSDELIDFNIDKYNLYVGENGTAEEPHPEESFYLVINVPLNDNTKDITANGYVSGKAKCGSIPINMNYTLRTDTRIDPVIKDNHLNTASTYSFLSGYTQTIADNSSDKVAGKKVVPKQKPDYAGRFFDINLKDTITFNSSQVYNDNDSLFYKLSVNLHNVQGSAETTSYFASGTEGEAKIYVKIGENNYIYNGSNWEESQSEPASKFAWKAEDNNGKLELVLCDSYGKAIDLAGIRKIAKNSGKNSFIISTEMEMHMSEDAFNESIMSSVSKVNDNYSQFYYRCMLATRAEALDYSSNSETCAGDVHYYQEKLGKSRITYSANDIKQLGINCSDLNTADGSIETTGSYILEDVSQNKGLIERANAIKYSLRLYKKKNDETGKYELVENPEEYIEVKGRSSKLVDLGSLGEPEIVNEPSGNYFVWTDNKSEGVFKTQDGLRRFTINISVKVKTDNVEDSNHFYSNYRLVLTAEMFESNERIDYPVNSRIGTDYVEDDNLESHSDYVTYSLTKIATDDFLGLNTQQ